MRTSLAVPMAHPLDEDVKRPGTTILDSAIFVGNDHERDNITNFTKDR